MHARNMRFYVYLSLILESVKKKDANRALTNQPARYLKTNNFLDGVPTFKLENSNDWLTLPYIRVQWV